MKSRWAPGHSCGLLYDEIYVYDIEGTWTNSTSSFLFNGVTYTVTAQTSGAYGYVRSYAGAVAYIIKGINSADFTTSSVFQDNPKLGGASRTAVTVNSIDVATTAVETQEYLRKDNTLAADGAEEICNPCRWRCVTSRALHRATSR